MRLSLIFAIWIIALASFGNAQANDACPAINLTGPDTFSTYKIHEFKVQTDPLVNVENLKIEWSLNRGEILSGQGTVKLRVQFDLESGMTLEVRVKVTGPGACKIEASETGILSDTGSLRPCPTFTIVSPSLVIPAGQEISVQAHSDMENAILDYQWQVDKGIIAGGQGTRKISIGTTIDLGGTDLEATLTIRGLPKHCTKTHSVQIMIAKLPTSDVFDEFGNATDEDLKLRIDNLFIALQADDDFLAEINLYGPAKEVSERLRIIQEHIFVRGFDAQKCILNYQGYEAKIRTRTRIFRNDDPKKNLPRRR